MVAEVDNPICRDIVKGKVRKNKFAVLWDYKNERWNLDVKSTTLVIRPHGNKLNPIQDTESPENCDLYVRVFKKDHALLVSVNLKNIAETMNLADISFISASEDHLLDLYITRKNDPDYLISVVPVDPETLMQHTKILIELPESTAKLIDWENVSFYTKPVFKNYGIEFNSGKSDVNIGSNHQILRKSNDQAEISDINIYILNDQLHFESSLKENQMYYFDGKTKFNVLVCDQEIDNYVGCLELNTARLVSDRSYTIPRPSNWPDAPLLIYKNRYLRISYTGEKNVHAEH